MKKIVTKLVKTKTILQKRSIYYNDKFTKMFIQINVTNTTKTYELLSTEVDS